MFFSCVHKSDKTKHPTCSVVTEGLTNSSCCLTESQPVVDQIDIIRKFPKNKRKMGEKNQ